MIDFDHIKLIKENISNFAEKNIKNKIRDLDRKEKFSIDLLNKMANMGLLGIFIPNEFGGQNIDYMSYISTIEEIAKYDSSQAATIAAHNSLGVWPIYKYGSDYQKKIFLPKICKNNLWAFGLTESNSGSDVKSTSTKAHYDLKKDKWIINGSKTWITNASTTVTHGFTILAKTGVLENNKPELTCFLIPSNFKGIKTYTIKNKLVWRSSNSGEIFFENVEVSNKFMLGKKGDGFKIVMETLDSGRLSFAAIGLGLAKGVFKMALKYSKERYSFSKPIFKNQAISFKLSQMATDIYAAQNILYKACELKFLNKKFKAQAAMAKLYCSKVAQYCAKEAKQIFGAYGLSGEYDIERFYRDAAILSIGEGTDEMLNIVISRNLDSISDEF